MVLSWGLHWDPFVRRLCGQGARKHCKTNGFSLLFAVRQHGHKTHRTRPKPPQDVTKTASRRPQDAPRIPQDAPRRPQDAPRRSQDAPKTLPRRPKTHPRHPKAPQDAPRTHARRPKTPQSAPKTPQDAPRTHPRRKIASYFPLQTKTKQYKCY